MALPKEPRQKMINLMYLVLTALLALNVSSEILNAFKVVNRSLENSNISLSLNSKDTYDGFQKAVEDDKTREKAIPLKAKADSIKVITSKFDDYLQDLQKRLKDEAKGEDKSKLDFKEDDLDAATRLMDTKGEGKILYNRLQQYAKDIAAVMGPEYMKEHFPLGLPVPAKDSLDEKKWTTKFFHMVPTVAGITMLSKFQNDVKTTESQTVNFLYSKIGSVKVIYDKFEPIISTNATYLMPGQELEIKAGVGAFNASSKPVISIGGSNVPVDENGVGTSKRNVTSSGSISVKVSYTKPDGTIGTADKTVEYVVGTPSGASVSADRMNVFYIGVDNPVTVSPGVGWDKASASLSGNGSMSGSGDNRTVRVSGGDVTINVTAEGKTTPFKFRVKTIPDPYAMVGPSKGGRMASNIFKGQDFIRAQLDNFDFEAKFTVVSATVYFGGAGFQTGGGVQMGTVSNGSLAAIKEKMNLCKPGSIVSFDEIKVVGPDGRTRTIPPITFVLN